MRTGRRAGPVQSPGPRVSYPIALACTWSLAVGCGAPPREERSAIVISVDALNEQRVLGSVAKARIPSLHRFFRESACADGARPHFPAVTAPSHAAIWTGTWGTTHGITGSLVPPAGTRLDSLVDGFSYHQLNAEPLWIAAARQGRTVVAHHVTHAPGVPGYPGRTEVERRRLQEAARQVLEQEGMAALNGYNRRIAGAAIVSSRTHRFRPGPAWAGDSGAEPFLELSVPVGTDSLFLRVPPRGAVRLLVAPTRDLARAVEVPVVPEDTTSPRVRTLARHFSAPVSWRLSDSALVSVRVRAFAMSSGAREFLIAIPEVRVVEANTAAVAASYEAGAPAWVGNVPFHLWRDGLLGDTLSDSRAEWRLLELAELVTDGFMRGTSWALKRKPHLLLDYFSLGDDIDHALLGYGSPRAMSLRDRLWELVDIRIGALMAAAQGTPGSMLLLTGDHGMRVAKIGRAHV